MSGSAEALADALGTRVRAARQARHWTLNDLADASGLSRRMLIKVEQGVANPSLKSLLRLSVALGIPLPTLVEPPPLSSMQVTRAGQGTVLWAGRGGGRGVLVASGATEDVDMWHWTLGPGDAHASDGHEPGTRELLQVTEGKVTVTVNAETVDLEAGDATDFPGDVPHSYANLGPGKAAFSLTVFGPGAAPRPPRAPQPESPDP